jgi:site-specific DNA recombinase
MGPKANAVILARVSSKAQEDEGYSLDSQLKLLSGYCEKNGLIVKRTFKIAETASKEQGRRVFREMLSYIAKESVYHLAVEKTDRFTRNMRDAVAIDDWLQQDEDRRLHAVKENLLLHKNARSDVKFMWGIHLAVAKKYTDNLREEAMKGWAEKLAQGWLPHPPPAGYKTITQNGKRIHVPDPDTKFMVQQMFNRYLEPGQSIVSITEYMKTIGLRTKWGRPYVKSNIQAILTNPFYVGVNRFNGNDYPGAQEHLISKTLFRQVQQKMHKGRPDRLRSHNSPLKGLIRCEDCGSMVTWQLQKGRYYGVCRRLSDACKRNKLLREDRVEEFIRGMLDRLVCPSEAVIRWVAESARLQHKDEIENRDKLIDAIRSKITRLDRMDDGLYDDKLAGEISQDKYEEKHGQFMAEKMELNERLSLLDQSQGRRLDQQLVLLELSQKAADLYAKKSPDQKRLIISKLFKQLTIKEGSLSVEYTNFARAIEEKVQKTRILMETK